MVYLAVNNTDDGGQALVIAFDHQAALEAWQANVDRLTGDDDEPFGFRGEWGVARRVLTPAEALELIPEEKRIEPARRWPGPAFDMTEQHIALLRHARISWGLDSNGSPCVDPVRPYGSGDVAKDAARILGIDYDSSSERPDWGVVRDRLMALHAETESALQIVLCTGSFEPGRYVQARRYDALSWERVP